MRKKVYPSLHNLVGFRFNEYPEVFKLVPLQRALAGNVSNLNSNDTAVFQNDFGAAFTPRMASMDMDWLVFIRIKINDYAKIFIELWHGWLIGSSFSAQKFRALGF